MKKMFDQMKETTGIRSIQLAQREAAIFLDFEPYTWFQTIGLLYSTNPPCSMHSSGVLWRALNKNF